MTAPDPSDPFLEVQSDVQSLLISTRTLFSSYLRIRALSSSTVTKQPSLELLQSRSDLTSNLQQLSADLSDLLESIAAVQDDPYRFGLDVAEVSRRRGFVEDVTREVEGMREEVLDTSNSGAAASANINSGPGRGNEHIPPPSSFAISPDDDGGEDEDDPYGAFEQQTQTQMLREQDEVVEDVFDTVGRLRGQAETMGRELEEQGGMLEDVDTLADRVGGKLSVGVKKVGEVIRRNEDGVSSCCIAVLIFVLILLLILVIVL